MQACMLHCLHHKVWVCLYACLHALLGFSAFNCIGEQLLSHGTRRNSPKFTYQVPLTVCTSQNFFFQPISGVCSRSGQSGFRSEPLGRGVQTETQDTTSVFSIEILHGPIKLFISFWLFMRCLIQSLRTTDPEVNRKSLPFPSRLRL